MQVKKIVVLFGGCSPEYSVSLQSAVSVIKNMDKSRFLPVLVGITKTGDWYYYTGEIDGIADDTWFNRRDCTPAALSPSRSERSLVVFGQDKTEKIAVDAVFPVLHGRGGEDGTVQGICEQAGLPLVGCGTLASALGIDKDRAHQLAALAGVRVPASFLIHRGDDLLPGEEWANVTGYPVFVKPVKAGSSYGVCKVAQKEDLAAAVKTAFFYDDAVLIEECIHGFEVGCAVMGTDELFTGEVDEIELSGCVYSFDEKYSPVTAKVHLPARIPAEKAEEIKQAAMLIYKKLGCQVFARVDLFLTPGGKIVFNEINTTPGFTENSRFPAMMKAAGWPFSRVITRAVEMAVGL